MKKCKSCQKELKGRIDKIYCDEYCKSAFNYKKSQLAEDNFFTKVNKQLKLNRRILKDFNKAGKATVRKEILLEEGFNPKFFTHYWKNQKGEVYLFCFEFGFLEKKEKNLSKYILVHWQNYMDKK